MIEREFLSNYVVCQPLGQGAFAKVYCATHKPSGSRVAIKTISKEQNNEDGTQILRVKREISILKSICHPFIAELFEVIETNTNYYLVMEYVDDDTLLNNINKIGKYSEKKASLIFSQLILALQYLHKKCNIIHRDIKAENILFDSKQNIRLIDFGLSNSPKQGGLLKTQCGSPNYASPEIVCGCEYTYSSDIWSAGVLLYAMTTGTLPFDDPNMSKLAQKILYQEVEYPETLSDDLVDLLTKMLTKDPSKRITLDEIISHSWIHNSFMTVTEKVDKFEYKDEIINAFMNKCGFKSSSAIKSISNGIINTETVTYSILRREQLTNLLEEMTVIENERTFNACLQSATVPLPKIEIIEKIKASRRKSLNAQIITPLIAQMKKKHLNTVIYKI